MKTVFSAVAIFLLIVTVAFRVNSDEPSYSNESLAFNTSEIGKELLDVLSDSYAQRLAEYQDGRSEPARLIEVNQELYEAQRGAVVSKQRLTVAKQFLARAEAIEAIAQKRVDNGVGTSMDVLDAKASRLRAIIELATVSSFVK